MKNLINKAIVLLLIAVFFTECTERNNILIENFVPITNLPVNENDSMVVTEMDLSRAIYDGIYIPTTEKNGADKFQFSFKIKNETGSAKKLYYKVYYQNESYKFEEAIPDTGISIIGKNAIINPLCEENFYGSFEDTTIGFLPITELKSGESVEINDYIRITGNPRNEKKYNGGDFSEFGFSQDNIDLAIKRISKNQKWYDQIIKKAKDNKISTEKQLYMDALWVVNADLNKGDFNNRWKRNPRPGVYSFMLVVCDEENLNSIPDYIKCINTKDTTTGHYVNPYYYFLYEAERSEGLSVVMKDNALRTFAKLDMSKGLFINPGELRSPDIDFSYTSNICDKSEELYRTAHFEQFFHSINRNFSLKNIPVVRDVVEENYSKAEYDLNAAKYANSDIEAKYFEVSDCPCQTVDIDTIKKSFILRNPGQKGNPSPEKEDVGVKSRIGFTYGKYRAKIKFPELINEHNIWNGITNAYWMIYQDEGEWNYRRESRTGYIPKSEIAETDVRVPSNFYTEIDFEIIKASKYWPAGSYIGNPEPPSEDVTASDDIIVACTNWDLACKDPEHFDIGVQYFNYDSLTFPLHRWHQWYKALTLKHAVKEDDLFKRDYYYYEIDWQPEKIIWRIGPEKDEMKVIAVMDKTVTSIPNNQMVIVVTQEYHYSEWWPTSPWKQDFIPYPKNDIKGELLEFVIE